MDNDEVRGALWARYDAGELTADEVEARLEMLGRAAGDKAAMRAALDGPIPLRHRRRRRRTALLLVGAGLALLMISAAVLVGDDGPGRPAATSGVGAPRVTVAEQVVVEGVGVETVGCVTPELGDVPTDVPANPALLSEPAFLPEGYAVNVEESFVPGTDPDIPMAIAAGNPPPDEIRARSFTGELLVRMRTWRYVDAVASAEASRAAVEASCGAPGTKPFVVPDHPELGGTLVLGGAIPTTAFIGWRLDDRRFAVAVQPASDESADIEVAQRLAAAIALAELEAARNPPPAPAP